MSNWIMNIRRTTCSGKKHNYTKYHLDIRVIRTEQEKKKYTTDLIPDVFLYKLQTTFYYSLSFIGTDSP